VEHDGVPFTELQVETSWYCSVTVMGGNPNPGVIVAKALPAETMVDSPEATTRALSAKEECIVTGGIRAMGD